MYVYMCMSVCAFMFLAIIGRIRAPGGYSGSHGEHGFPFLVVVGRTRALGGHSCYHGRHKLGAGHANLMNFCFPLCPVIVPVPGLTLIVLQSGDLRGTSCGLTLVLLEDGSDLPWLDSGLCPFSTLISFHCGPLCPTIELHCWFLQPLSGDHILYHQLTPKCFCGGEGQRAIRCHLKILCSMPRPACALGDPDVSNVGDSCSPLTSHNVSRGPSLSGAPAGASPLFPPSWSLQEKQCPLNTSAC